MGWKCSAGRQHFKGLLSALTLLLTLSACVSGPPRKPENLCSIYQQKYGWHKASLKLQKKWKTPLHIPMAIMAQESSFVAKARPPRTRILGFIPGKRPSSAYGYAQAINGTWKNYLEATGQYWRRRDDFVDALDFIHWYTTEAIRINGIKRTDTYRLYLNYHEGLAGYRRGTYKQKKWLRGVARKVEARAKTYATQYGQCKNSLPRGWLR